jgi:hypothetical protein
MSTLARIATIFAAPALLVMSEVVVVRQGMAAS